MIELKNLFVVTAVGKTSTRLFKDIEVGDIIEISVQVSRKSSRRGNAATFYKVTRSENGYFSESAEFGSTELASMEGKGFKFEVY